MQVPWRAAEAMHWQLGETEMARRAGVVPFALTSNVNVDAPHSQRGSPSRGHIHSHSQSSLSREMGGPTARYGRGVAPPPAAIPPPLPPTRGLAPRRESLPPRAPLPPEMGEVMMYGPGPSSLAPIQTHGQGRGGLLPGVAELTTGVSPYSTPAYSMGVPSASPVPSATASPGPLLPTLSYPMEAAGAAKRRASPEISSRETTRRRHLDPRHETGR